MRNQTILSALAIGIMCQATTSRAHADSYPRIAVTIPVEIEDDLTFDADDPDAELNDLYATIEPEISINFTEAFSIEAGFVLEPVRDPGAREDRVFEDHGMYAEQLFVQYQGTRGLVKAGKFNPAFGWPGTRHRECTASISPRIMS